MKRQNKKGDPKKAILGEFTGIYINTVDNFVKVTSQTVVKGALVFADAIIQSLDGYTLCRTKITLYPDYMKTLVRVSEKELESRTLRIKSGQSPNSSMTLKKFIQAYSAIKEYTGECDSKEAIIEITN